MLVNNHAASKVKEFIARHKGLEVHARSENSYNVVTENPSENAGVLKSGTGVRSRRGLGATSNDKSASSGSSDLKLQLALSKRIRKNCRESSSKESLTVVENEEETSEEESKTKYQKTRHHKNDFQQKRSKMAPNNYSVQVNPKNDKSQSVNRLPDQTERQVQREDTIALRNIGTDIDQSEGRKPLSQFPNEKKSHKKSHQKNQYQTSKFSKNF